MIPILYKSDETTFNHNGIGMLTDCTSCIVTEERNGIYECEFKYPLTGIHYSEIFPDRIVKVKPNDISSLQLFRIYKASKPIDGIVTFSCQHISYDLAANVIDPFEVTGVTAVAAITNILNKCYYSHGFTCTSTSQPISAIHDIAFDKPVSARYCLGSDEGCILDVYAGGEYEFDNFVIKYGAQRGQDSGVTIIYGKNLTGLTADISAEETYTAIYPYGVDEDGEVITLPEKIVASTHVSDYGEPRLVAVDLTDMFDLEEEDIEEDTLREKAQAYIEDNQIYKLSQSLTVSFVPLWKTEEYKNVALLERVGLCDLVTVQYPALGVSVKMKVTKTVYDSINERYNSITLGELQGGLVDSLAGTDNRIRTMEQAIKNSKTAMQKAIENATDLITGQTGGYVVLHQNDDTGEPFEILIMNTNDIQTATKVWRWNSGGFGYSNTGYSGPYGTAITMDGAIVADYITTGALNGSLITAGTLSASKITTGIIKDTNNTNYWNLETGEFRLASNTKVGTASSNVTLDNYISNSASTVVTNSLTQRNVFNALTNNGALQGIYMSNNNLYINGSYIRSGTIDASIVNVSNINADNITAGTLSSVNNVTSFDLSTGKIGINQANSGETMELDANGITLKYNGSNIMHVGSSSFYYSLLNGKRVTLDPTTLRFSNGDSGMIWIKPNNAYSELQTNGDLTVSKKLGAKSVYVPYSYRNDTFIDFRGLSYNGKTLSPTKISINGANYYVLAYREDPQESTQPFHQTVLNLSTTSILNSPYVNLTIMYQYVPYVVAAYDTTQTGSGTDITTADVSYMLHGFDYELVNINNRSYAILTMGDTKEATTDYDKLENGNGKAFSPLIIYFNDAAQTVFGYMI